MTIATNTNQEVLNTREIQDIMREHDLMATAFISGGRYICRVANTHGKLISHSSNKALSDAVGHAIRQARNAINAE